MLKVRRIPVKSLAAAAGLAVLAACATPPPPPAPTPTPIPSRPTPPGNAAPVMFIPPADAFGTRQTVNTNLSSAQMVWNLRSAMNVAALNCLRPGDEPILTAYSDMLKSFARPLSATNRALDSEFRQKYGASYATVRDQYMTQVYNYFALPPVMAELCDTAVAVSNEYLQAKPEDFDVYAAMTLPRFEQRFLGFFGEYERWRQDVAAWDARYGAEHGHYYPAYVEAERKRREAVASAQLAGVPVPATGATVVDAPAQPLSGPVVQSLAGEPGQVVSVPVTESQAGAVVQPLPDAQAAYGPVSPQVQTVVEPAPQPEFSLPARAREEEPQAISQPVIQGEPAPQPAFTLPPVTNEEEPETVSQPVVQQVPEGEGG